MASRFLFYNGADETFLAEAPYPDVASPEVQLLKYLYFNPSAIYTEKAVRSASNGILWLPFNSIVAAFASGRGTNPPAPDLVPCAFVTKYWHQNPNQHISVWLVWRDKDGYALRMMRRLKYGIVESWHISIMANANSPWHMYIGIVWKWSSKRGQGALWWGHTAKNGLTGMSLDRWVIFIKSSLRMETMQQTIHIQEDIYTEIH